MFTQRERGCVAWEFPPVSGFKRVSFWDGKCTVGSTAKGNN